MMPSRCILAAYASPAMCAACRRQVHILVWTDASRSLMPYRLYFTALTHTVCHVLTHSTKPHRVPRTNPQHKPTPCATH